MRWHPPSARWTDSAPLSFSFYVSKCVSLLCFASYACLFCFQWKYLTEMVWRFEDVLWSTLRPGGSYTRERQGRRGRWPRKSRLWTPPQLQGNLSYSTGIGQSFLILPSNFMEFLVPTCISHAAGVSPTQEDADTSAWVLEHQFSVQPLAMPRGIEAWTIVQRSCLILHPVGQWIPQKHMLRVSTMRATFDHYHMEKDSKHSLWFLSCRAFAGSCF